MSILSSVKATPEFASLCSYIKFFGDDLNVSFSHSQLENFLEIKDFESTPKQWIDLHRKLLSRIRVQCVKDKFESSIKKFINTTLSSETTLHDLYDKDYYSISAQLKARVLNIIFDCQFDRNVKFKEKVNLRQNKDLRMQPFGSDIYGCLYWFFVDSEVNMIMYKENLEEESFKIIAESIDGMCNLLNELKTIDDDNVDLSKLYIESVTPEDTNSPNNELDIVKEEESDKLDVKPDIVVKIEESNIGSLKVPEINGNRSPIIKSESISSSDKNEPTLTAEATVDDNSEPDNILIISTVKPEENGNEMASQMKEIANLSELDASTEINTDEKKKRGRKPKISKIEKKASKNDKKSEEIVNKSVEDIESQELNVNLRRSERKRKPVNPFTIMYTPPSTKKSKITDSQNDNTDLAESECNKNVKVKAKDKDHSKRGKPNKPKKHSKESKGKKKMKEKSKHKNKVHKKHKNVNPWEVAESSEEHIEEEEDLDQHEESEASHNLNDEDIWNDKPESDFDADKLSVSSDEETLKSRGRNYFRQKNRQIKAEQEEVVDDKPCQICLSGNLPEMILLCDNCDFGHHAMCLKPSLMLIPEGDWFCPKCQHKKLVNNLTDKIAELDKLLLKNAAKIRMQERLDFVNISMTNILSSNRSSKHRHKSSNDDADNDSNSVNDSSSPSYTSSSETDKSSDGSSSSGSEKGNHGRYKFRESSRKEPTRYNFEEIDKMFDNALENDEKYQMMKKRQEEGASEESEPEYDYSGIEPRKKSSGKDMSNILEEEKPRLRRPTKRKRLTYASDDDDFEDDVKDQDFKLSDQSCLDADEDDDKLSENDASDSDEQWTARPRRSTRRSHRKRDKKKRRIKNEDVVSRPRRSAARKVSYLEMLGDDDDDEEKEDVDEQEEQHSPDFESSDEKDTSKPPPVLARKKSKLLNRRRKISDSEYEESKDNSASDSDSTEELDNAKKQKQKKLCLDSDTDSGRDVGDCRKLLKDEEEVMDDDLEGVDTGKEVGDIGKGGEDGGKEVEDGEKNDVLGRKEVGDGVKESLSPKAVEMEECVTSSLSLKNPMRAKDDQDIDVENEVESETDSEVGPSSMDRPVDVPESGERSTTDCLNE